MRDSTDMAASFMMHSETPESDRKSSHQIGATRMGKLIAKTELAFTDSVRILADLNKCCTALQVIALAN